MVQWVSLVAQLVKNPPAMQETWVWEDPLEKGKATHFSILAWRIPWTIYSCKESDMTEQLSPFYFHFLKLRSVLLALTAIACHAPIHFVSSPP